MSQPRKPKFRKGRTTRDKILTSGINLYAEKGYHRVTADDISKAAGFSVGTFYAYFEDKFDLLLQIIEHLKVDVSNRIRDDIFSLENVRPLNLSHFIDNALDVFISIHTDNLGIFNELESFAYHDEDICRLLLESDQGVIKSLLEIFRSFKPTLEESKLECIAYAVFYATQGMIKGWILERDEDRAKRRIEFVRMLNLYLEAQLS